MTATEAFVLCSAMACTVLIIWWMRTVPDQVRWLRGLIRSRGEAPEEFDTQPRTGDRDEWDGEDAVLLTHEGVDLDDAVHDVDFTEFETQFTDSKRAQRWAAQLEERAK